MTRDNKKPAITQPQCWDCEQDPIGSLKQMFVDIVQSGRIRLGQDPARRPVFLKLHGVAHGRFEVRPDLPENLKIGVFAMSTFPAWVRFSSDTLPTDPDLKTTLGIGIKLFGVPGDKLLDDGDTHDFILQNFDIFFVDTAKRHVRIHQGWSHRGQLQALPREPSSHQRNFERDITCIHSAFRRHTHAHYRRIFHTCVMGAVFSCPFPWRSLSRIAFQKRPFVKRLGMVQQVFVFQYCVGGHSATVFGTGNLPKRVSNQPYV